MLSLVYPTGDSSFFLFLSQIIPPSNWACPSLSGLPLWQGCHTHYHTPLPPHYREPLQLLHCGGGEEGGSSTPLLTPERPQDHWTGGGWVTLVFRLSLSLSFSYILGECRTLWGEREQAMHCSIELLYTTALANCKLSLNTDWLIVHSP